MDDIMVQQPDELLATCWSSAGDAASDRDDLRSPLPLRERIEAASATGYRGFGLLSDNLRADVAEYGLSGIRAMLADNGIVHLELEGIPYWWDSGQQHPESDPIRHGLLQAAEVLGARHIKVTPDGDDGTWDRGRWAEKVTGLATQAQAHPQPPAGPAGFPVCSAALDRRKRCWAPCLLSPYNAPISTQVAPAFRASATACASSFSRSARQ